MRRGHPQRRAGRGEATLQLRDEEQVGQLRLRVRRVGRIAAPVHVPEQPALQIHDAIGSLSLYLVGHRA